MLAPVARSTEDNDEGFTLIELLVVIIIIGILAAIAIPVFLNQRKKGWDAAAKSDLRSMATAQETYLADNGTYTYVLSDLGVAGYKPTPGVVTNSTWLATSTPSGSAWTYTKENGAYVMLVQSQSGAYYCYTSRNSGLQKVTDWANCTA